MASSVVNNPDKSQYELLIDGEEAGISAYRINGNDIVFTHTVVDTDKFGHGLGGPFVQAALDDVRDNTTYRLVDQCPFVRKWISEHREYEALRSR